MKQAGSKTNTPSRPSSRLIRFLHRRGLLGPLCGGTLPQTTNFSSGLGLIAQFVILLFSTYWSNVVRDLVSRFFFGG